MAHADEVLVGGKSCDADPLRAMGLYQELLREGVGAAGARLAVLAAIGVGQDASLARALEFLTSAAESGYRPAQRQLAVLAGRDDENALSGDDAFWRRIAANVDIDALIEPPSTCVLRVSPFIAAVPGFASPAMCRWVMRCARSGLKAATVSDVDTGALVHHPMRTAHAACLSILNSDVVTAVLQTRLARLLQIPVTSHEAPSVISYAPGERYDLHYDFLDPNVPHFAERLRIFGQRVATCLTYLNEDYTGGETYFAELGWKYRGKAGDALLFRNTDEAGTPDKRTLHAGLPPLKGRKWLLSQWIRNRTQPLY